MPRCILTATITFGLVSIPVKLYTAAAPIAVEFNMITPAGNRVKQKLVDAVTNEEVERDKLLKGYEHTKNQYVTFTADEIKAAEGEKSNVMEIAEFVPLSTVDLLGVEKSYYLGPDKGGDKGYGLLAAKLAKMGMVAVATWSRNGKEQLILVRPYNGGLVLHQMYYANEIRDFEEIVEDVAKVNVSAAEDALSEKLIEALANPTFIPEKYEDGYHGRLTKLVEAKVEGRAVEVVEVKPVVAPMLDLAAILAASLEKAAKKPAAAPPKAPKAEKAEPKKRAAKGKATQTPA